MRDEFEIIYSVNTPGMREYRHVVFLKDNNVTTEFVVS